MSKYGKECKINSDCSSNICEMTYIENDMSMPDKRKCIDESYYTDEEKKYGLTNINKKNSNLIVVNGINKNLHTNIECNKDSDCDSGLCEKKYRKNEKTNKIESNKFCINQEKKYGKVCHYNNDCDSNRCVSTNNTSNRLEKKCLLFENEPEIENEDREFGRIKEDDLPPELKSDAWKHAQNEDMFLNSKTKAKKLEGRGPITDIIVLLMEIVVLVIKEAINLLLVIWKRIFWAVSFIPSLFLKTDFFNTKRNQDSTGKCIDSYTISAQSRTKLIAILFPPYGVFMHLGASGMSQIIITSILSILLYFPGLMYAFNIIEKVPKPTVPESQSFMDKNEMYNMFFYGQLINGNMCITHKFIRILTTFIFPPLGLYLKQKEDKKVEIKKIIICFILTAFFYFPGLFYSLINVSVF